MKLVKNARPEINFWATLKTDYSGYGDENNLPDWIYTGGGYAAAPNTGVYDPTKLNITKYARFLADYLLHMKNNDVPITYMTVSKEWMQVLDAEREKQTIDALVSLLATPTYQGVTVPQFVGPAGWGVGQTTNFVKDVKAKGYGNRYIGFSTHDYDGDGKPTEATWVGFMSAVKGIGESLNRWQDESTIGGGGPNTGVEAGMQSHLDAFVKHAMWYRTGLQGELFFESWSRGIAKETRAIYFAASGDTGRRMRGYYMMKHFGNTAGVNSHYISSTQTSLPSVESLSFRKGNQVVVWVINNSTTSYNNVATNITGTTLASTSINRLIWQEPTIEGIATGINPTSSTQFVDTVPATSIVAYTFNVN